MAIFDTREQRVAVRVVYDGVACAGKTTNLRQLCTLFAAQRGTELYSPSEMDGRTLYFDWMQLMAGAVCGFPLLCQVVSVPGQVVLTPRRRYLLETADVVVYVCESNESAIATARAGLALYDELSRQRGAPVPLVIQANKQDQPGALDGASLARALGREGTPVIEGIASDGVGVVDTFVMAVRTVARALQSRSERGELRIDLGRAESAAATLARVSAQTLDPEWAAEMLLEEALAAHQMEEAVLAISRDAVARNAAEGAGAELGQELAHLGSAPRPPAALAGMAEAVAGACPALPSSDVPTGFIWPAHTGRAIVGSLHLSGAATPAGDDGSFVCVAHGHVAVTSMRSRYGDAETARQALVRNAREGTQLERFLVPETVLVAQTAPDAACWIWTVRPDVPTIESLLLQKGASSDLLTSYGVAVVEVLRIALRHKFSVNLSPRSFGWQNGAVRYLGEVGAPPPEASVLSRSMFVAVEAIERAGADVTAFLDAFERALERNLTAEERARATHGSPTTTTTTTTTLAEPRTAGERLTAVLARASEAS